MLGDRVRFIFRVLAFSTVAGVVACTATVVQKPPVPSQPAACEKFNGTWTLTHKSVAPGKGNDCDAFGVVDATGAITNGKWVETRGDNQLTYSIEYDTTIPSGCGMVLNFKSNDNGVATEVSRTVLPNADGAFGGTTRITLDGGGKDCLAIFNTTWTR